MKKTTTKKLVLTALLMALTTLSTLFIRIPLPLGYVNMGDAFVFLSVFILGPVLGTLAAGCGSALADLIGYPLYAPGTLIIKSAMAIIFWLSYQGFQRLFKKHLLAEILAGIAGALVMAFGYFAYEILLFTTSAVAIVNVWWNLLQAITGIIVAAIILQILSATKILEKLKQ